MRASASAGRTPVFLAFLAAVDLDQDGHRLAQGRGPLPDLPGQAGRVDRLDHIEDFDGPLDLVRLEMAKAMPPGPAADGGESGLGFLDVILPDDRDAGLDRFEDVLGRLRFRRGHELDSRGKLGQNRPDVFRDDAHGRIVGEIPPAFQVVKRPGKGRRRFRGPRRAITSRRFAVRRPGEPGSRPGVRQTAGRLGGGQRRPFPRPESQSGSAARASSPVIPRTDPRSVRRGAAAARTESNAALEILV